ncbi:MAG: hypothetical protein ACRC6I_08560, partial [Paracoccaceae bacterium]
LVFVTFAQTPLIRLFAPPAAPAAAPGDTSQSFARKWRDGLSYVRQHPAILIPMIILSATYSVAQLTNVMVPVFVQNDLGAGVATYGTMEMFWAIGGIFVLLLVRGFRPGGLSTPASLVLLSVTGLTMIAFALIRDIPLLIALYFALGALFSVTRLVSDSQIMTLTETAYVGRVRAANLITTNGVGILIFALPWFVETTRVTNIYIAWGAGLLALSMALFVFVQLAQQKSRSAP